MLLEHISCDLCGSNTYRVRYRKPDNWLRRTLFQFPVVECLECSLVYVNPRPTIESMRAFYPGDYHSNRDTDEHIQRYKVQASMLPGIENGKVLDIGCANGDFLGYLLDQGSDFEAYGIDALSESVGNTRIQFKKSVLTDAGYPDNYFDFVMAWAVFEHLHHPKQYFEEVSRILKPGKQLLILVTNSESIYGRYAGTEDVPRHTYHFSRKTLSRYGRESGLRLSELIFNDDIFDGRGMGLFGKALSRLVGLTWEVEMLNKQRFYQRIMGQIGRAIDRVLFGAHWEARLGLSGIMVARFVKD